MNKFLSILSIIIVLLLVSGYIENYYCHSWVTTPPLGRTIQETEMIAKTYTPDNTFCRINAKISIPGALLLGWLEYRK
jgi:hypothetical protein